MIAKRLLNAPEVAERLGIAKGTVYNLAARGKIPVVRIFGALRFDVEDIESLIRLGRTEAKQTEREGDPPPGEHS